MNNSLNPSKSKKPAKSSKSQLTDTPDYQAAAQAARKVVNALSSECAKWETTTEAQEVSSRQALYKLLELCSNTVDAAIVDSTEGDAMYGILKSDCEKLGGTLSSKTEARIAGATLHVAFPRTRGDESANKQRKSQYKTAVMAARKHRGKASIADWIISEGGLERVRSRYKPNGDLRDPRVTSEDVYFGDSVYGVVEGDDAIQLSLSKGHKYVVHIVENDFETGEANIVCVVQDQSVIGYLNRHGYGKKRLESPSKSIKLKDWKAANDADSKAVA